jgi:hypothetical protein
MRKTTFALLTAAAFIAVGCASAPTDTAAPITEPAATTKAKAAAKGLSGGVWKVPGEVKPGTYTTDASEPCYWARLKGFDGEMNSIIANGNVDEGARGRLTVKATDKGLQLDGACIWTRAK